MRLYVGPEGPHTNIVFANDRLCFTLRQNKRATDSKTVNVGVNNGVLDGVVCTTFQDGSVHHDSFTGTIARFRNASRPLESTSWVFRDHYSTAEIYQDGGRTKQIRKWDGAFRMENLYTTPKIDFSATGEYANLRTDEVFEDFWLHAEFNAAEARNSGIY